MTAASALTTFLCWKNRLSLWHQTYDTLRHPSISMWHFHPVLGSSRPQSGVGWGMWWFPHCCIHCYSMLLHDTRSHVCSIFTPGSELKLAETETVRSSSIKFDRPGLQVAANAAYLQFPTGNHWDPLGSIGYNGSRWDTSQDVAVRTMKCCKQNVQNAEMWSPRKANSSVATCVVFLGFSPRFFLVSWFLHLSISFFYFSLSGSKAMHIARPPMDLALPRDPAPPPLATSWHLMTSRCGSWMFIEFHECSWDMEIPWNSSLRTIHNNTNSYMFMTEKKNRSSKEYLWQHVTTKLYQTPPDLMLQGALANIANSDRLGRRSVDGRASCCWSANTASQWIISLKISAYFNDIQHFDTFCPFALTPGNVQHLKTVDDLFHGM